MNLSKQKPVQALLRALEHIKNHPGLLLLAAFIDALFFLAYGFITAPVSDKIIEQSVMITNELSKQWAAGLKTGLLKLVFMDPAKQYTGKLLMYLALLFLLGYFIYCVFQAVTWTLALRTAGHNQRYFTYLRGFMRVNLVWFACYILYRLLDIIVDLRFVFVQKFEPAAINILGGVVDVLFFLIILAAIASYPRLIGKTIFSTKIIDTLGFVLLSLLIILNAQFFTNQLSKLLILPALGETAAMINLFLLGIFFALFMNLIKIYAVCVYGETHK